MTPISSNVSAGTAMSAGLQEARQAAQQKRQEDMKSALTALQSLKKSRASVGEEQKAAARQKIEQIKARIRMMRMSMPADPKAAARMVAQLARELGAAVKAYASAGGAMSDVGGAGAPQAPTGDATATDAATAGGEDAAPQDGAAVSESAPGQPQGSARDGESSEDARRDDPYRQSLDRQQSEAAERHRRNAETQADKEVLAEVKKLVRELKAMLNQSAQSSSAPKPGKPDQDVREAEKALASVEGAVADASAGMAGAGVSITV